MLSKPNILVCTDFSSFSFEALKVAERLRRATNGKITVLHVSEHPVMWDWMALEGAAGYLFDTYEKDLMSALRKKLSDEIHAVELHGESVIIMGVPHSVISEQIAAKKIDLVIMGHKGRTSANFPLGSLAQKMIATSPVPILVVKGSFESDKIAALVDPTEPMNDIIQKSEELSFLFSSKLEILSLFPDIAAKFIGIGLGIKNAQASLTDAEKEEILTTVKERIKNQSSKEVQAVVKVEITEERKVAYQLNALLEKDNINFIVMKRHQVGMLEKIMIGSETRRMLEIFQGNIFVLPP